MDEPFGRQPKPVMVRITGEDMIDVEYWHRALSLRAESHGDMAQRLEPGLFKIYPRAVND